MKLTIITILLFSSLFTQNSEIKHVIFKTSDLAIIEEDSSQTICLSFRIENINEALFDTIYSSNFYNRVTALEFIQTEIDFEAFSKILKREKRHSLKRISFIRTEISNDFSFIDIMKDLESLTINSCSIESSVLENLSISTATKLKQLSITNISLDSKYWKPFLKELAYSETVKNIEYLDFSNNELTTYFFSLLPLESESQLKTLKLNGKEYKVESYSNIMPALNVGLNGLYFIDWTRPFFAKIKWLELSYKAEAKYFYSLYSDPIFKRFSYFKGFYPDDELLEAKNIEKTSSVLKGPSLWNVNPFSLKFPQQISIIWPDKNSEYEELILEGDKWNIETIQRSLAHFPKLKKLQLIAASLTERELEKLIDQNKHLQFNVILYSTYKNAVWPKVAPKSANVKF